MDSNKVSTFLFSVQDKIPSEYVYVLRERLEAMDDDRDVLLMTTNLKSPLISLLLSLFLGLYGIDRFYIGDTTMGVLKLLTCGGMGIWTIIDWFLIMQATKQKNIEELLKLL